MCWNIIINKKTKKNLDKLPKRVVFVLQTLTKELACKGMNPGPQWPNLGKIKGRSGQTLWHCHLIKGKPTYVCCWELIDKQEKLIEVYYVGTHEKAPY